MHKSCETYVLAKQNRCQFTFYFFSKESKVTSKHWGITDAGILKRNLENNLTERLLIKKNGFFFIDANIFSNCQGNSFI